jgi:hypothetical protein
MIKTFDNYINESKHSKELANSINLAIDNIDDSLSYIDFAKAVASVIKEEYGSHIYSKFINELKNNLR